VTRLETLARTPLPPSDLQQVFEDSMDQTTLRIDGHQYLLTPDQDLATLRRRLRDAVAGKARFVEVGVQGGTVSLLVGPRSSVQLERFAIHPVDPVGQEQSLWSLDRALDFDLEPYEDGTPGQRTCR